MMLHACTADTEVETLTKTFHSLDTSESGVLTIDQVKEALVRFDVKVDLSELISSLDIRKADQINYTDFIAACISKRKLLR